MGEVEDLANRTVARDTQDRVVEVRIADVPDRGSGEDVEGVVDEGDVGHAVDRIGRGDRWQIADDGLNLSLGRDPGDAGRVPHPIGDMSEPGFDLRLAGRASFGNVEPAIRPEGEPARVGSPVANT